MAKKQAVEGAGTLAGKGRMIHESRRCLQCQEPNCAGGCPIGVGLPSILSLVSSGRLEEARALLRLSSPLASITGRLCPSHRFCEHACILARKGSPVAIHSLESFLGDISLDLPVKRGKTAQGNILIVGSGPTGLTVAHDLLAEGFTVTVYEREPSPGGWLRTLPPEILPPGILEAEIKRLVKSGISIETSHTFDAEGGMPPKGYCTMVFTSGPPNSGRPAPVKRDSDGFIVVDEKYHASKSRVYAAGGAIARFNSLTEAMASGREMVGSLLRDYLFPPF